MSSPAQMNSGDPLQLARRHLSLGAPLLAMLMSVLVVFGVMFAEIFIWIPSIKTIAHDMVANDNNPKTFQIALRNLDHTLISPATLFFAAIALIGAGVFSVASFLFTARLFARISLSRASAILVLGVLGLIGPPALADDAASAKAGAVAAMQTWLAGIDQNHYAQSWMDASASFQKAVSSDQWIADLNRARTPLGKCTVRKLASSMQTTEVPSPAGPLKGDFVVAQFDSSFENLAYAVETVCFEKASDGTWKASGYYVKPRA